MAELKQHFRPEFLNRVDDVIIFQSLDEEELAKIVDIQLERLEQTTGATESHARRGQPPRKNCWRRKATTRNSARVRSNAPCRNNCSIRWRCKLLEGEFKPGDRIKVTADGEGLVFKVK